MAGSRQSLRSVPPETFGALLRQRRHADDLTQAELGERFHVTQQTIGAWERGDRPQAGLLADLAVYVGLSDERALLDLLDRGAPMSSRQATGVHAVHLSAQATDAELMKQLTQEYLSARSAGTLTREDREIFRELIAYYRDRTEQS